MHILILGGGGREHALAWKISQSKSCTSLFIAPGNAGTTAFGKNLQLDPTDFVAVGKACRENNIQLLLVGPEEPLVKGIVDYFLNDRSLSHIPVIGPNASAARLEGSKAFSKQFMRKHGIPTAAYKEFDADHFSEGSEYVKTHSLPVVLKADGLAAGKGVLICQSHIEAMAEFELMLQQDKFGEAGRRIVVEEFLDGIELSVFVLTDGDHYVLLPEAKDYKKIGEGDKGPNTGGMGAVSPVPFADSEFMLKVKERIIDPTIKGLKSDGIEYRGFIFIGLIKVGEEPMVIEYNCRLGDPETEVIIPRLKNDLVELLQAVTDKKLNEKTIQIDSRPAATMVAVSRGYPGSYEKGFVIRGLDAKYEDSLVFHSGTQLEKGQVVTNGGRVLCVTSYASSLGDAIRQSMTVLTHIDFDGMYFRRDIGYEFL
ncbi:MAG TPA: phosphoribosylamine--glycine ligase [Puia sp.]|jgi:phosphoribosylamine--glycine ligase|nr:phosphoribosylamine--glycine ligase [Puia sp.]